MKASIDPDLCIGCGLCISISPAFGFNAHGQSEALVETTDENRESVRQTILCCPMAAISDVSCRFSRKRVQ